MNQNDFPFHTRFEFRAVYLLSWLPSFLLFLSLPR